MPSWRMTASAVACKSTRSRMLPHSGWKQLPCEFLLLTSCVWGKEWRTDKWQIKWNWSLSTIYLHITPYIMYVTPHYSSQAHVFNFVSVEKDVQIKASWILVCSLWIQQLWFRTKTFQFPLWSSEPLLLLSNDLIVWPPHLGVPGPGLKLAIINVLHTTTNKLAKTWPPVTTIGCSLRAAMMRDKFDMLSTWLHVTIVWPLLSLTL